jgi:hypothetical protein
MKLIESGDVSWDDPDVAKTLKDVILQQSLKSNNQEIARNRKKSRNDAPSARLTPAERARIQKIQFELALQGVIAEHWELKALTRGATMSIDGKEFSYLTCDNWPNF